MYIIAIINKKLFQDSFHTLFQKYDARDRNIPWHCPGYPCAPFIRIYNSKFENKEFNGYYIINYVGENQGKYLF